MGEQGLARTRAHAKRGAGRGLQGLSLLNQLPMTRRREKPEALVKGQRNPFSQVEGTQELADIQRVA